MPDPVDLDAWRQLHAACDVSWEAFVDQPDGSTRLELVCDVHATRIAATMMSYE